MCKTFQLNLTTLAVGVDFSRLNLFLFGTLKKEVTNEQ